MNKITTKSIFNNLIFKITFSNKNCGHKIFVLLAITFNHDCNYKRIYMELDCLAGSITRLYLISSKYYQSINATHTYTYMHTFALNHLHIPLINIEFCYKYHKRNCIWFIIRSILWLSTALWLQFVSEPRPFYVCMYVYMLYVTSSLLSQSL